MINFNTLATEIKDRLLTVLGHPTEYVPLHEPQFSSDDEFLVADCIRSGWVSSVGEYVDRFEEEIARICGTRFSVATVNGTAALEVALRVAGVVSGDEILMPSLTFVAGANAVHHLGAIPHFVDVDKRTLGIDPFELRSHLERISDRRSGSCYNKHTGRRLSAVVPMHVFGHPVNIDELETVAREYNLLVVEDAAEALGSCYKGKACGGLSLVGALSFNGNKILTTGGGGAIVTNNAKLAQRAKHLTTTAKANHTWAYYHDEIGYNYRLPNLNAALGVAQLGKLENRLEQKRRLAQAYIDIFADHPDLKVFREPEGACSNYWLNTLVLEPHAIRSRDLVLKVLNDAGIMARPVWEPLHTLPIYSNSPQAELPVTDDLAARIINIPSSAHLAGKV